MTIRRLLLFAALASCTTLRSRPADIPLRVMTFNIRSGAGNLPNTAARIRVVGPDIVALQEVDAHWSDRSAFADQPRQLEVLLRMSMRFAPIYRLPPATSDLLPREFGVALLTRHRIVRWHNDSLTRLSTQDPNPTPTRMPGLAHAVIVVAGRRVSIITVHLDYRADPSVRRQQVAEIVEYLKAISEPVILAGDLNATPDAEELAPLFAILRDVWLGGESAGYTYPASAPAKRIDYVLVSRHFRVVNAGVVKTDASDHLPVVAELFLRN